MRQMLPNWPNIFLCYTAPNDTFVLSNHKLKQVKIQNATTLCLKKMRQLWQAVGSTSMDLF